MNQAISVNALEMHFPGCDALQGIDLSVESGTVFALLGENGAGKTTLIRILMGYQRPSVGTCRVLALDPVKDDIEIRRRVGYVSDAPALYDWMQVGEIGWFASAFYPDGFIERYRQTVDRYGLPADRKIKHLSKGQRAKVALALALAHDPELLILDEPTSGLDPLVRREFMESMIERAASGRSVFLSSHQIAEVERVADTIAILHHGKVRIVDSLNALRESVHEVTVSLSDPLITLPQVEEPTELLSEETQGRQRRYVLRGEIESVTKLWQSRAGVVQIQSRPATLDELFVACTRGMSSAMASQAMEARP